MRIRNQTSLSSIIIVMLICIVAYTGMLLYWQGMTGYANVEDVPEEYQNVYDKLEESRGKVDDEQKKLEDSMQKIVEADSTFQVALNGLRGLGTTLRSLTAFIGITHDSITTIQTETALVPGWVFGILLTGVLIVLVLIILSILKGDPNLTD
jgi:uncharacterized membrane protein YdbT with pleckstrin-like domain